MQMENTKCQALLELLNSHQDQLAWRACSAGVTAAFYA